MNARPASLALCLALAACTGTPDVNPSRSGMWEQIAPAPLLQQEIAAASAGGKLYVAGGYLAGGTPTAGAQSFDPRTRRWTVLPKLPIALHHPAGAAWNGAFVVAGGFREGGTASSRVFSFDGKAWSELPPLRHARGAAAMAQTGNVLVVAGGIASGSEVATTEVFDGKVWRDRAPIPVPRDHVAGASDGVLFYVALGRAGGKHLTTFTAYDPAADKWKTLPNVPGNVRSGGGAAAVNGRIVVAGGESDRAYADADLFDVSAGSWSTLPSMTAPRHGFGLVALSGAVYALLGGDTPGLAPVRSAERLADGRFV